MGLIHIRTNPDGEHVQFRPDAAASFRRMEAQKGRELDVNRTVVDRAVQADLYAKRQRGEYPYPVAHPDKSDHVYRSDTDGGNAWDTDERGDWLEDNGWIADVDGEPRHRRYIPTRDNRRDDPDPEEDDMYTDKDRARDEDTNAKVNVIHDALFKGGTDMKDANRSVSQTLANIVGAVDRIEKSTAPVYDAVFKGGISMPDGGKSIGESLAER